MECFGPRRATGVAPFGLPGSGSREGITTVLETSGEHRKPILRPYSKRTVSYGALTGSEPLQAASASTVLAETRILHTRDLGHKEREQCLLERF